MWINVNTQKIYDNLVQVRMDFPTTSLPDNLTNEILLELGISIIVEEPKPLFDPNTKKLGPYSIELIDGVWTKKWSIVDLSDEEKLKKLYEKRYSMNVSRFQFRAALLKNNLLDIVSQHLEDPTIDPIVKLAWQEAIEFKRMSPAVIEIGNQLGITETQLDNLFEEASTIDV